MEKEKSRFITYKEIRKEISRLLSDKDNNADELDKQILILRNQKALLDKYPTDVLSQKLKRFDPWDNEYKYIETMMNEKEVYSEMQTRLMKS